MHFAAIHARFERAREGGIKTIFNQVRVLVESTRENFYHILTNSNRCNAARKERARAIEREWYLNSLNMQLKKPLPPKHYYAFGILYKRIAHTCRQENCNKNSIVLDIGCGTGNKLIAEITKNVIGVDIVEEPLKEARKIYKECFVGDCKSLCFRRNEFDFVIISGVLHHLEKEEIITTLDEATRILKEGGLLIICEPNFFYFNGLAMNILNKIRPGIIGLDKNERTLSPLFILYRIKRTNLENIKVEAATYAYSRFPISISRFIEKHEKEIAKKRFFDLFGWWAIISGTKCMNSVKARASICPLGKKPEVSQSIDVSDRGSIDR
jgi:ubiquinone/menaquinone biosynthesis C-methylase UbiE